MPPWPEVPPWPGVPLCPQTLPVKPATVIIPERNAGGCSPHIRMYNQIQPATARSTNILGARIFFRSQPTAAATRLTCKPLTDKI